MENTNNRGSIVGFASNLPGGSTAALIVSLGVLVTACALFYLVPFAFEQSPLEEQANGTGTAAVTELQNDLNDPTVKGGEGANRTGTVAEERIKKADAANFTIVQPHCRNLDHVRALLGMIETARRRRKTMCMPEDANDIRYHFLPFKPSHIEVRSESREQHFVVYIAVGLLLTSLGAAFLDLFKAKRQMVVKEVDKKGKPQLLKRCSLADLTVLRHNRRENARKESIAEGVHHYQQQLQYTDHQRDSLGLLGTTSIEGPVALVPTAPLVRRCSFPVALGRGIPVPLEGRSRSPHSRKFSLVAITDSIEGTELTPSSSLTSIHEAHHARLLRRH